MVPAFESRLRPLAACGVVNVGIRHAGARGGESRHLPPVPLASPRQRGAVRMSHVLSTSAHAGLKQECNVSRARRAGPIRARTPIA